VLITNGSLQATTLVAQANIEMKYNVICETPCFKGIEEAARQRLVAIYNADNPGWWARSQLVLGDFLIRLEEKMKARYSRPLALDNDICRGD
jgi:hypothetical protein